MKHSKTGKIVIFMYLHVLILLNTYFVENSPNTLPGRPGSPLERCVLKNWCGKMPELFNSEVHGAS